MGAPAPISPWIPEDDFLLKTAIEAGASLESLAKGAVRFSRRFTIPELQERWHSLLYDPVISAEASVRMVELQNSASNLSSNANSFGVSKGNEVVPGKRKEESVRSLYYAMRKRICTEPCSSVDLSYLVAPSFHYCTENGGGCQEQLTLLNKHPRDCMIGDPIADNFELQDTDFDIVRHAFSNIASGDTAAGNICDTAQAFHSGHRDSFEGDLPNGIMGRDCLYGFAENVSPVSVNEAVGNDMRHAFEHDNVHKDIPHILGESLSLFDNNSGVQEIGPPQQLPVSAFDSISDNPEKVCSGFGGNQDFISQVSDCGAAFNQLGYSSPLPAMPMWRTIEDITTPAMPIDENLVDKDKGVGDTSTLNDNCDDDDDAKKVSSSGYNVVCSGTQLKERECGDGLASSTALAEGAFMDISDPLLNFTHEEVLLFLDDDDDDDGKDMMDRSCLDGLNSILLNSPNDTLRNDIAGTSDPKASVALDTGLAATDVACPVEFDVIDDPLHSGHKVCGSDIVMPSAPNPHSPELRDGVICCILNTEDYEVPCNDGLFLPNQVLPPFVSFAMQHNSVGSSVPTSTKDFTDNQKASDQGLNLANEEGETPGIVASQMIGPQLLPEICPNHSIDDSKVKSELLESDSLVLAFRHAGSLEGDPSQCGSLPAAQPSIPAEPLMKELTKVELGKHSDLDSSHEFLIERPIHVPDHLKNQPQKIVHACKQEADVAVAIQSHASTHEEPSDVEMAFREPMPNSSISDEEEHLSEDDDDVPYFSDIEAMILDMDLGPCDQDSSLSKEVSRYQYEDTKRAIIRLEQGANSYMQRATTSHRAFALLYGRQLKHYIKKPEVILGRATDDVFVDIDLGKEGRANKISRRQAIIKMEEDGSFYLKNLGKCSVLVNSKEVASGERLKLNSSSLIEIRGMRFLFEVNKKFVRQHLAKNAKKNQDKSSKFEWSADGVP